MLNIEFHSLLGMSYNPSYRDHQDLLQEVANKELTLIKEEKHLKRVTCKMFSRVTEDEREVPRFVKLQIKECAVYRGMH
jgi:nucleolar protein 53